jgi:hypothetical protein
LQTNNSPRAAASARGGNSGWYGGPVVNPNASFRGTKSRPQTADGYTGSDAYATQQAIRNVADRPVSSNRGSLAHGSEGARLASGSLRAKQNPHTTQSRQSQASSSAHHDAPRTVDPNSPFAVYDPSTRTFIHKQDAMAMHRAISDAEEPPPRYEQHHREASQQRQPQRQTTQPQAPSGLTNLSMLRCRSCSTNRPVITPQNLWNRTPSWRGGHRKTLPTRT